MKIFEITNLDENQVPPTKDEIKRGLNQVPDGDSGATISQAGKTRRNRSAARREAQDELLPTTKGQALLNPSITTIANFLVNLNKNIHNS
jgi:hypothetical protein